MATPKLHWNRAAGDMWADLFLVDLDDRHFTGLEGVLVIWVGGAQGTIIKVASGVIREEIRSARIEEGLASLRGQPVYVSWSKVDAPSRAGVAAYLAERLKPRMPRPLDKTPPIEVNLPGLGDDAPADVGFPPPKQASATPAPAPAPKTAQPRLVIQPHFLDLVQRVKGAARGGTGFFGAGAKPSPHEEQLVSDVVQLVLREALKMRASDIHLEPMEAHLRVRYRIDGILEEVLQVPHSMNLRIVSNIRVMCSLDPEKGQSSKPEDARASITIDGKEADLRLSTFPTSWGDKAVLRVIPRISTSARITELNLSPKFIETLRSVISRPQGMIVVTGPTGSGKSTTLYALLQDLNDASKNIVTLEDPVERKVPGVTQGMIQPKQGFGFAEGLRAILRQDPNVIMVGEIRDQQTAEIALSASLTGHLLITTLHTVSALGAVARLLDMNLEPYIVASALTAVTAQRLARMVCANCAQPTPPTPEQLAETESRARRAGIALPDGFGAVLKRGRGCDACRGSGFNGRMLIFECILMTPPIREAIVRKGGIDDLKTAAARSGMTTLLFDGLSKAAAGLTTLDEVLRVVDAE